MNILWQITNNKRLRVVAMTEWGDTSVSLQWWFWIAQYHKCHKLNFMLHKYLYIQHCETQALLHLHNNFLESQAPVEFSSNRSRVYISSIIYVYTKKSTWNSNSTTTEPDWPQHDHPTTCVITQHYFSTYSCTSQMEKFGMFKKCLYFTFFTLLKTQEVSTIV